MPIANCFVDPTATVDPDAVMDGWSRRAGIAPDEMTVNVVRSSQGGKRYAAMGWLWLPTVWSEDEVRRLGEGLAASLADALAVTVGRVQVVTMTVGSGRVVEDGTTLDW